MSGAPHVVTVEGVEWEDCGGWWMAPDGTTIEPTPQSLRPRPDEQQWTMLGPEGPDFGDVGVELLGYYATPEDAMRAYAKAVKP